MSLQIKKKILTEIKNASTVIIARHKKPDGDAVGSTMGLKRILELSFPEKKVFIDREDECDYTAFLGDEGPIPSDADYENALVIVCDCGNVERVSGERVRNGKKLIKIDHHIDLTPYGDVSWVEEERSSVCEMITEFWHTFRKELKIDKAAASCLYAGMVTDSGRFKYPGTSPQTLRLASYLLEQDIYMDLIYMNLYIDTIDVAKFEAYLVSKIELTESGVAHLFISRRLRKARGLTLEEASNTVGVMDAIKGSLIWIAFIENDDGTVRARLRSRFIDVQKLAAQFGGGGHENASGATLKEQEDVKRLLVKADELHAAFKADNPELF